jgi:hypothetical protein
MRPALPDGFPPDAPKLKRGCWPCFDDAGRRARQDGSSASIRRFFGVVIAMYFDDHGPPHFHARHAEGKAKVRIDTLEVIGSSLARRQLRFVFAWAELHQASSL